MKLLMPITIFVMVGTSTSMLLIRPTNCGTTLVVRAYITIRVNPMMNSGLLMLFRTSPAIFAVQK